MGATFFNSFAYWVEQVALGWLVLSLTNSTFMVGLAYAARMVPFFFLGIPAGSIADRLNRRLFLRSLTAGICVTWFVIAVLVITGVVQVWQLILLALIAGCLRAFFATTYTSLVYDITGASGAVTGMAWSSIVSYGSGIVGAGLGGRIIASFGAGGAYLASGAAFVASLLSLMFMRESGQAAPVNRGTVAENFKGAVRVLRTNRVLLAFTILTATSEMFGFSASVVLPTLARDVLGVGSQGLGLMTAVRAGAGMIGPLVVSALGTARENGQLVLISMVLFGGGIIALGFVPNLAVALVVLAAMNAAGSSLDVLLKSLMQAHVSNEERGRAMGAWVVGIGVGPVGQMEIGGVAGALGVALGLVVNGGLLIAMTAGVFLVMPRLRHIR